MNTYHYDLHIHSCLSPCGDNDMTPNNLVQMALLSGCDVIALTDHNTCRNAPAAMEAGARNGLLVIPGMELCTAEEAHVVCLFETLEGALEFDHYIYENMPHVKNRPEIFGEQRLLDGEDGPVGEEENLLLVSSFVGVDQVVGLAAQYGGVAFPAHVDRDSFSVIASLGAIPAEAGFTAAGLRLGVLHPAPPRAWGTAHLPGFRFPLPGDLGRGPLGAAPAGALHPGGAGRGAGEKLIPIYRYFGNRCRILINF